MTRKLEQLQRIERIRKQLADLSAWKLGRIEAERRQLEATHAQMLDALGDGLMAYGPASLAGTRRVRALEREMAASDALQRDLARKALDDGRLAKLAEERLDTLRAAERETLERKSLEELIDMTMRDTGSRKP